MTEEEISNLLKSKIETKDLTKEEIITYLKKDVLQKTCDSLTQLGILGLVSIIEFENVAQYQDIVVNLVAETINRFGEDLVAMLKETIQ